MCSNRMASARDRGPKLTTTVISTTETAGCDVTIAPDSGSLAGGDQLGEVGDLGPDAVRRPADGLPQRPRARQYLHDHLGELPRQRGSLARCRGRRGRPRCSGGCWRGAADVRVGRGRLARHRARGSVGLAVVRWPARGDRDEPQPGGCGWRGWGGLAGGAASGPGGVGWPGTVGGSGVRVLDGMFRLPGPENANGRERLGRPRSYQAPAGLVCTSGHRHFGVLPGYAAFTG